MTSFSHKTVRHTTFSHSDITFCVSSFLQ